MNESDGWPESAKNEIARLEGENEELQLEIGRSTARILALQAEGEQITDGEVKKRFEKLSDAIEDWTTSIDLDFLRQKRDFRREFNKMLDSETGSAALCRWGFLERPEANDGESGRLHWLSQLDTCIKLVLARMIWYHLYSDVFAQVHPPGTDDKVSTGLRYVTEAIRADAEGRSSEESIARANRWRSSAFHSLKSTKMFKDARRARLQKVANSLWKSLSRAPFLMDDATLKRHFPDLQEAVVTPAADLKQEMACSTVEYTVPDPRSMLPEWERWHLHDSLRKDVVDWRAVPQSQPISGILLVLVPGIYKINGKDIEPSMLANPVLSSFYEDAAKEIQRHQAQATRPRLGRLRKTVGDTYTYWPSIGPKAIEGAPRRSTSRRAKQPAAQGLISNSLTMFGAKIRGPQHDEGSRSHTTRTNTMDSAGSSPSEDKNSRGKSRTRRSLQSASSSKAPKAIMSSPQARHSAKTRRQSSVRDSPGGGDPNVTPRNTASNIPATAGPHRESDGQDESFEDCTDDASSINSTSAMCDRRDESAADQQIVVETDGGAPRGYIPTPHSTSVIGPVAYSKY